MMENTHMQLWRQRGQCDGFPFQLWHECFLRHQGSCLKHTIEQDFSLVSVAEVEPWLRTILYIAESASFPREFFRKYEIRTGVNEKNSV